MNEGRAYVLRVWQLAEELAVQAGKPLHAFLLLHHLLTRPPASLHHASTALLSSTAPPRPTAALPLHVAALDAEWKCEELATRVRAAEYLLSPAAQAPVQPMSETSDRPAASRTLSRAAALESLELAEQVLAPVFTTTSSTAAASSRSATTASSHALEATMREVAQASTAASQKTQQQRTSSSSPLQASLLSCGGGGGGGGTAAETRGAQMYFFNESTVTALAWPLSAFLLDWPGHTTEASATGEATVTSTPSSSALPLSFKAANHTIMVAVALVVRAHVLQAVVCYRRVQYRRALQCLAEARKWVQLQFTPQARQRSLRLLWADLRERWCAAKSAAPVVTLGLEQLPHFERIVEHLMEREQRACETMISVEECRVHWMVLQSCGTVPPPPLPRPPSPLNVSDAATTSSQHADVGDSGQAGANTPDLRLHFKRYHESVQQLHQVSRVYMAVLEWTASVEETEEDESPCRVRVKREREEHSGGSGSEERAQMLASPPSRAHVWRAQSQLSPFCLCALHRCGRPSAASLVEKMERVDSYVVAYDQRLAAEVLGWYHCMSLLFLLYEPALPYLAGSGPATSRGVGACGGAHVSDTAEQQFLDQHARAPPHFNFPGNAPRTAAAAVVQTTAVASDPVQRARAHFRAYAAVFGGTASSAATAWGSGDSTGGTLAHEARLLWCLAELALVDGYPAALRFCASLSDASQHDGGALSLKKEPKEENEALVETRKRGRSALCAPASSHWVAPGVRGVLQLYVRLQTVLMQAAATMPGASTPPLSPSSPPPTGTTAVLTATSLPVPVMQAGLQRAERVLARLLFTLDREMLQLTGNACATVNAFASTSALPQQQGSEHSSTSSATTDVAACFSRLTPWVRADQLQSSPPAQLRWFVQLKSAALLAMARHHSTQLSLVRAVHHLRELQHFTRVFHRQAKVLLVPEIHLLLAAIATCMSLRRLPEGTSPNRWRWQPPHRYSASGSEEAEDEEEKAGFDGHVAADLRGQRRESRTPGEALFAFARGWPQADASAAVTPPAHPLQAFHSATAGRGPVATALYSITPGEESTIAQDVGLPYLHLLAAERAACTSLHTPPSLILLLYLMKAWAVYQLVVAGEELTWTTTAARARSASPLPMRVPHPPLPSPQQQQQHCSCSALVSPLSPACPPLPLPTVSYATTTLNTTQEDQQRRVARLDSLTSTPTQTPTLRSRHATFPGEMQRIQLEPPLLSPGRGDESNEGRMRQEAGTRDPVGASAPCLSPPARPLTRMEAVAGTHRAPPPPPLQPLPRPATIPRPRPRAEVTAVPQTVRHRAADVLQRMLAVLRHHHEGHTHYMAAFSPTTVKSNAPAAAGFVGAAVPTTAWTPQNITLYRLLHAAVTLTEDRDELAAARELKETTHYAKQHLGVLHPFVADGLALLTSAYTSLDVDAEGVSSGSGGGAARTRRVAVQLAMRCSCTALASLAESDTAGLKAVDLNSTPAAQMTPLDGQADPAAPQLAAMHARLREWWSTKVLRELCGNGSVHRSTHALGQLQALFGWLPGVEGEDP